jgi:hypothetical protein
MPLYLADELFLLAHDVKTGKLRLPEAAFGTGLGGALLAELVLAGSLVVAEGHLAIGAQSPPADELAAGIHLEIEECLAVQPVSVRDWLGDHGRTARDEVGTRLRRSKYVECWERRWLGRSSTRYVPTSPGATFVRTQRLSALIRNRVELSDAEVALGRLALAISGGERLVELDPEQVRYLEWRLDSVPHAVRQLLAEVEGAVQAYQTGESGPP